MGLSNTGLKISILFRKNKVEMCYGYYIYRLFNLERVFNTKLL